jgi:hypothetical protein
MALIALNGVFMRFDVNHNFFENDVVCTMLFSKTEGGEIRFYKYPVTYKRGLRIKPRTFQVSWELKYRV